LYKHSLIEFPLYVLQNLDYKKKKVEAVVPNLMSLETRNHVEIKNEVIAAKFRQRHQLIAVVVDGIFSGLR
jgi:hypothetical protein